jgi:uncharacterized repeat protein (TIGR01451 family)
VVAKADAPDPARVGGEIVYTITVSNKGPAAATSVQLADPLDGSLVALSAIASQGACVTAPVVTCSLGAISSGASVTVVVRVRATRAGRVDNTATAIGAEPEANPTDNSATTSTLVVPVTTPPTPPTKPRPPLVKGEVCIDFRTVPLVVRAGKASTLRVVVTRAGKPVAGARVVVRGAGVRAAATSGAGGVALVRIRPARKGFLRVTIPNRQTCRPSRQVGVVPPVLLPPVTG